nr:hypothetical protein [Gymnodinialimonas phycosphaerae]
MERVAVGGLHLGTGVAPARGIAEDEVALVERRAVAGEETVGQLMLRENAGGGEPPLAVDVGGEPVEAPARVVTPRRRPDASGIGIDIGSGDLRQTPVFVHGQREVDMVARGGPAVESRGVWEGGVTLRMGTGRPRRSGS